MEKLLSMHDVAETLGVSIDTVRRMQKRGEIVFSKIGRSWKISEKDLMLFYEHSKAHVVLGPGRKRKKEKFSLCGCVKPIGVRQNGNPYWV